MSCHPHLTFESLWDQCPQSNCYPSDFKFDIGEDVYFRGEKALMQPGKLYEGEVIERRFIQDEGTKSRVEYTVVAGANRQRTYIQESDLYGTADELLRSSIEPLGEKKK